MFCKECGSEVDDSAKFCSKCGAALKIEKKTLSTSELNRPVITVRPVFIPSAAIIQIIPQWIFMTIWSGGFFGGFGMIVTPFLGLPIWSSFVICGGLAFIGVPALSLYTKSKTYSNTSYTFFPDRLEYREGFWNAESKTIKYKNIIETNLTRSVIQKKHGLGTLILSSHATSGAAGSGIAITDIYDSEHNYDIVRDLIG